MHLTEDIKPITYLKTKAADVLKDINETHRPLIVTQNGEAKAVLQDIHSYETMKNALGLFKLIAAGEEDIKAGRVRSQDDVFDELEKSLQ